VSDHCQGRNIYRIDRCDFPRVTGFDFLFAFLCYVRTEFRTPFAGRFHPCLLYVEIVSHSRSNVDWCVRVEGVLEDEERRSLSRRWRIRWVRRSWFVFEVEGCAEKSRIHDENPQSFKVPDGNLVTYKHESVKRRSQGEGEAIASRFVRSMVTNARDDRESYFFSPN